MDKTGVLLINLGTPNSLAVGDIRRYLRQFLSDERVIDVAAPLRWFLVNCIIAPFRAPKAKKAYSEIWTERGSPLKFHTMDLAGQVADQLGEDYVVEVAMRYQQPSLKDALARLRQHSVRHLVAIPLYPQYAASSSASSLEAVYHELGSSWNVPGVTSIDAFYDDSGFIAAQAESLQRQLENFDWDHLLFSYHGLPERHLSKSGCATVGSSCQGKPCDTQGPAKLGCYRQQSYLTTEKICKQLEIPLEKTSVSFQSRLGRTPWIQPYTDQHIHELHKQGVRRLAVVCPSFVADCLETIEEIGIQLKSDWLELDGTQFKRIECMNSERQFAGAISEMVRRRGVATASKTS